jgi:hypothetical protein
MPERSETIKNMTIIVAIVVIVGMFLFIMNNRQGAGSLTIKTGDSELVLDFSDNKVNFTELIDMLLKGEKYKNDTLSILRDSYGLYNKDSELLVDYIRRQPGNSAISEKFRELLVDLRGPFERKYHNYYDITLVEVVDAINSLGYDHEVPVRLRELKDSASGIFEQRGIDVDVAVISAEKILDGNAAVCEGSKYRGRDLLLLNQSDLNKTISVFARNSFQCIKPSTGAGKGKPLVQINPNDATKLFGNIIFKTKERAILYPTQSGYSIAPKLVGN